MAYPRTLPGYAQGLARNAGESLYPNLWQGLLGLWVPHVGVQGQGLVNLASPGKADAAFTNLVNSDWIPGRIGYALNFGGSNQYLETSDTTTFDMGTSPFTVMCWAYSTAGNCRVMGTFGADSKGWGMYFYAGADRINLFAYGASGSLDTTKTATINDSVWHHVAGVYTWSGTTVTIEWFLDGVSLGTASGAVGDISTTGTLKIGSYLSSATPLAGKLDDVRIYNRALTPQEIAQSYAGASPLQRKRRPQGKAPAPVTLTVDLTQLIQGVQVY